MTAVWRALESLTEKERLVLALRFRHEKTPDEIGRALGETLARVRGLEASALWKLHERLAPRRPPALAIRGSPNGRLPVPRASLE